MVEIIDITKKLRNVQNRWAVDAMNELGQSPIADDIVRVILNVVIKECKIGLGLEDDDDDDMELPFFNQIHEVYQEAASDCYFCSDIDPNEIPVTSKTKLCLTCMAKLKNFMQRAGIDMKRKVQG